MNLRGTPRRTLERYYEFGFGYPLMDLVNNNELISMIENEFGPDGCWLFKKPKESKRKKKINRMRTKITIVLIIIITIIIIIQTTIITILTIIRIIRMKIINLMT